MAVDFWQLLGPLSHLANGPCRPWEGVSRGSSVTHPGADAILWKGGHEVQWEENAVAPLDFSWACTPGIFVPSVYSNLVPGPGFHLRSSFCS